MSDSVAVKRPGSTPLMQQYYSIKEQHPGTLLLFRMGDFYETFDEDAIEASRILEIVLTRRSNGSAKEVPLAGFPHHALQTYLPRLIKAGKRVAVCEQLEETPTRGKLVRRGVVEIVTPGVSLHEELLSPKRSRYLAALHWQREKVGLAYVDASTGEFLVSEVGDADLADVLGSIQPAEILMDKVCRDRISPADAEGAILTFLDDWVFSFDYGYETLRSHFQTHSLRGFGVEELKAGIIAAGAALHYLSETQKGSLLHIRRLARASASDGMTLDPQTRRNLELVTSLQAGRADGTLVEIMDRTLTAMGARLLRRWLTRPLCDAGRINGRLQAVDALVSRRRMRESVRALLKMVGDLERLAGRICTGRATPRELVALGTSLAQVPQLQVLLKDEDGQVLGKLAADLRPCPDVVERISQALNEEPPANWKDGGIFRDGYHEELDELRLMARSGKEYLVGLQTTECERTGIPSLKVGFNKVFGYYLEITNAHKDKVPEHYIRKQTLVNAERYITPELKEYEESILGAEESLARLEGELFGELRRYVAEFTAEIQDTARLLSVLDCLASFAQVAEHNGYCRPVVDDSLLIQIADGRHPVVERSLPTGEDFIPNSIDLDPASGQIYIITGPNMAGKSVVLRQVGLVVLLAQAGSFVPATSARIGVVDRIFTRVGASDSLAKGESTFLVEMNETANILNNATRRSLVLLDEVGRGTSTFDGMSIAWALVEHLHSVASVAARTLFATHYHELNELAKGLRRVRNFRIQVREHEGRILFLRRLIPGGADHSYGIEVARMAGLPQSIIDRAREILFQLESQHRGVDVAAEKEEPADMQLTLFPKENPYAAVAERLRKLDPDHLTPMEALFALAEIKRLVDGAG